MYQCKVVMTVPSVEAAPLRRNVLDFFFLSDTQRLVTAIERLPHGNIRTHQFVNSAVLILVVDAKGIEKPFQLLKLSRRDGATASREKSTALP